MIFFFLSFDSQRRMFKDGMKGNREHTKIVYRMMQLNDRCWKKKVAKDDSIQKEERK